MKLGFTNKNLLRAPLLSLSWGFLTHYSIQQGGLNFSTPQNQPCFNKLL